MWEILSRDVARRDSKREKLETEDQLEGYFTGPLVVGTTIVMAVGISKKGRIQRIL